MYKLLIKSLQITNDIESIATINVVPPDGISLEMHNDKGINWVDLTRVLKEALELIDGQHEKYK